MAETDDTSRPPTRLRTLAAWQAGKVSTLGARFFAQGMSLGARADFAVLAALEEYGPLSQAGIGRSLRLDRNDVNGILNRLATARRIARRADPSDGRRKIVTLTKEGRRHLAELQRHTDAVHDQLLIALSAVERRQLTSLLAKVLDSHPPQPA